ncbi:MAG: MBOAT family protein [Armatimonadota bacterium]|nr:MBOAT family protein [Armatimonadota bacterium]
MVFSSHIFLYYFLPFSLAIYYSVDRLQSLYHTLRLRNAALALLGYVFYASANPKFVILMLFTTVLDWLLSLVIAGDSWKVWQVWSHPVTPLSAETPRSQRQRAAITFSVVSNLAMLGFFKYFNFGVDTYNSVVSALGLNHLLWSNALQIYLPLGISFYTFQSLSYTIDVYRGEARAMRNFTDFACFVSMFPHLVAGPILKFEFLAEQLEHRVLTLEKFGRGTAFFMLGLAKKILIANPCGQIADMAFTAPVHTALDAWCGVVAYAFQIFFDFSGYSDMAIGLGLMLGFVFARNFDHPYRAESITDFWRRWHISLSTWLREYLYIPLGGNRKGKFRTYANLMITMLLGGLWHGASWTFVIWGGIQGGMLALERSMGKSNPYQRLPRVLRIGITFVIVLISWVFFRAESIQAAGRYLGDMVGLGRPDPSAAILGAVFYQPYFMLTLLTAAIAVWCLPDPWEWTKRLTMPKVAICIVLFVASLLMLASQSYNPFIYFRF